jgi:hypothetical protein
MASRALKLPTSYALCVSQSERLIAAVGPNVVVADLYCRKRLSTTHPLSHPSHVDISADDRFLVVKSTWGEIAVLDIGKAEKLFSYRPRLQDEGTAIKFSASCDFLVDGSWSGEIRVRQAGDLSDIETFAFEGEMITAVSRNERGDIWLFAHTTKFKPEVADTPAPYLSLWEWPLRAPQSTIKVGLKTLDAAALAPTAPYIAVVGFCEKTKSRVLRILSTSGAVLAATTLIAGGTGSNTRWSPDSKLVGTVSKGRFVIYSAPDLTPCTTFAEAYPADLAFLSSGSEVALGSWSAGRIVAIEPRDA